jgi:hypothetical protein
MSLGINRGAADLAVEGLQSVANTSQEPRHNRIYPSQKMMPRNALLEVEKIKQLALLTRLATHHDPAP